MEIDLTKDQKFKQPVKCWVRDDEEVEWSQRWLLWIYDGLFMCIDSLDHSKIPTTHDVSTKDVVEWKECRLDDPNIKKPWKTIHDIPPELWGKAFVKLEGHGDYLAKILDPHAVTNSDDNIYAPMVYTTDSNPIGATWHKMES